MTYLELVNRVLVLMREPTATSLATGDDVVVDIVAQLVNDAKRTVENAHNWNALRHEWTLSAGAGEDKDELVDTAGRGVILEDVYAPDGSRLQEVPSKKIRHLKASSSAPAEHAMYYAVNGIHPTTRNIEVQVYPEPTALTPFEVYGFRKQPDLAIESDVLLVPAQPVVYFALALASRERGEVGGQTSTDIFGMASNYLKDAIAEDVALNQYDYDWHVG